MGTSGAAGLDPMDWFTSGAVIKFNGSASGASLLYNSNQIGPLLKLFWGEGETQERVVTVDPNFPKFMSLVGCNCF